MSSPEDFAYTWDDPRGAWVLLAFPGDEHPPAIFNRATSRILLIEDDEVYAAVVQRMRDAGVAVVTHADLDGSPPSA